MSVEATSDTERRPEVAGLKLAGWTAGAPLLLGAILLAGTVVLFFFDPHEYDFYPPCLFHNMTGLNCPGCGATRAAYALLHGQVVTAFRDNALLVLSLPLVAAYGLWTWVRQLSGKRRVPIAPLWYWMAAGVTAIFTVWRNLPSGAWLSP